MKEALKIRLLDDLLAVLTGWKKIGEEGERGRDAQVAATTYPSWGKNQFIVLAEFTNALAKER